MINRKRVGIIGVSGSIGRQAIDVIQRNQEQFELIFITAHKNKRLLDEIAEATKPKYSFSTDEEGSLDKLSELLNTDKVDIVLHAVSGIEGITSAMMVVDAGIDIALANKESLVTAGNLIIDKIAKRGSKIIPVDSEHSAIFQSLIGHNIADVDKIILTASGGPFKNRPEDSFSYISREEALKHPKWSMGQKISIDSATMVNKGLELIEARYLFNIASDKLDVVIHPESIIHSMVSYIDGATVAQLGYPDMRTPISYALSYPNRTISGVTRLRLEEVSKLTFYKPDYEKFKALKLAKDILLEDRNEKMIMLNSSNQAGVSAFIEGRIRFTDIVAVIEESLGKIDFKEAKSIEEAIENSRVAFNIAESVIDRISSKN